MDNALVIFNSHELLRVYPQDLVYISADHNYSEMYMANGDKKLLSFQLGTLEEMIKNQLQSQAPIFIRIGRGYIINRQYIYYINLTKQNLILKTPNGTQHSLTIPRIPLELLKSVIEQESKQTTTP